MDSVGESLKFATKWRCNGDSFIFGSVDGRAGRRSRKREERESEVGRKCE